MNYKTIQYIGRKENYILRRTMRYYLFILTLFSAFLNPIFGQELNKESEDTTFYSMSLDELINFDISVASKQEEKLSDAPGSITAYSNKDLENFGYYTLRDLADITSGYSSFRGIGEISFETRGQYAGGGFDNNKHLVLIDGIPFSHTRANRANAEEDLPLFFAKRVEFLKGPGSALYGISAFYGVINIVSKDLEQNGTLVETKTSVGSYDFKKRLMTNVIHRTGNGISKISIGAFSKDASRDLLGNGTSSQPYNLNAVNYDDQSSLFLNISHQVNLGVLNGIGVGVIYSKKTGGLGDFWMFDQNQTYESNELTWEQIVPYLKYKRKITSKTSLNSYIKGNISTEHAYIGGWQSISTNGNGSNFSNYNIRVYDTESLLEFTYDHTDDTKIVAGGNIVSRFNPGAPNSYTYSFQNNPGLFFIPDTALFGRSSNYNTYSAYAQLQQNIDVLKGLIITAGARMDLGRVIDVNTNKITNKYDQISPRIALVQKITDRLNAKAMYGAALRAPLIKEVGLNEEFKNENPNEAANISDVTAETIETYEVSINYNSEKFNVMANYFKNHTNDPISKVPSGIVGKDINGNTNGYIEATGYEIDLNILPTKNWRIGINYSSAEATQYNENDSTLGDVFNVPTNKLNTYVTFKHHIPFNYSITLTNHNISNYRAGGQTPWGNYNNELMDGYSVFDINLVASLTRHVSMEFMVRNLFDSEIKTPTFYAANNLSIPFAGRSFMGTIGFKF